MSAAQKNLKKKYDVAVIGAGLTGLLIAKKLRESGVEVVLFEQRAHPGGHLMPATIDHDILIDHRLRTIPLTESVTNSLQDLSWFLQDEVEYAGENIEIQSFDGLKKSQFVGFGDKSPEYYDVLKNYLEPEVLEFNQGPSEWIEKCLEGANLFLKHEVTSIEIEEGSVARLILNGSKKVTAGKVIMTANPKTLLKLVTETSPSAKFFQKLHRQPGWTSIGIDFLFSLDDEESGDLPKRILFPGTQSENFPTVGAFKKVDSAKGKYVGQFLTFVEERDGANGEITGAAVRRVRKQFKKYLPKIHEKIEGDRVTVSDCSHASLELKLNDGNQIPGIENLFLAHRSISWPSVFPCEASSARKCAEHFCPDSEIRADDTTDDQTSDPTDNVETSPPPAL